MTAKITLTWDNGSSEHVDQIVYRSAETFTVDNLPPVLARTGRNAREYIDTDIVTGNVYFYAVASENAVGEILLSSVISVTADSSDGDPHWDKVVSLLHFDGDLTDEIGRVWESVGSSVVSSDESVFGGSSLKVPTTTGLVRAANSVDFDFGSGDFTIEFFLRPSSVTSWASYLDKRESGSFLAPFMIQRNSNTNQIMFRSAYTSGSWAVTITATHPPLNMWAHVVYERWGGVFLAFINGVQVGSADGGSYSLLTNTATLNIASTGDNVYGMAGYIDELRITKGVARYTENFTPPTEPFLNF